MTWRTCSAWCRSAPPDRAPQHRGAEGGLRGPALEVNLVMEQWAGDELFDRIIAMGHYSKRVVADMCRPIVTVVHNCHSMEVMHRVFKMKFISDC